MTRLVTIVGVLGWLAGAPVLAAGPTVALTGAGSGARHALRIAPP